MARLKGIKEVALCKKPGVLFFFCLLFLLLSVAVRSQERYLPISEAELSRLELISDRLKELSTMRQTLETTLRRDLSKQAAQITTLSAQVKALLDSLEIAKASAKKSEESLKKYESEVTLTLSEKEKELTLAKDSLYRWKKAALISLSIIGAFLVALAVTLGLKIVMKGV